MNLRAYIYNLKRVFVLAICLCTLSSCGAGYQTAAWGVGGTAVGAGAGALVGSLISNGDILASAGLGAGVGLASGVLIGFVKDRREAARVARINRKLDSFDRMIYSQQLEIESQYGELKDTSQVGDVNESLSEPIYDGPSIGVYGR